MTGDEDRSMVPDNISTDTIHLSDERIREELDATPNDDLRELIEKWRGKDVMFHEHWQALQDLMDELEEVVEGD